MSVSEWAEEEINRVGSLVRGVAIATSPDTLRRLVEAAAKAEEANVWERSRADLASAQNRGAALWGVVLRSIR